MITEERVGHVRLPASASRLPGDPVRVLLAAGLVASVLLHARMALGGHGPGWSIGMAVMAVLCLSCLPALVRAGAARRRAGAVRMVMGMALAMAFGHVLLLPLMGAGGGHAHHGALPAGTMPAAAGGAAHGTGALLVISVELAVAALAVLWLRRHGRRPTYRSV
ncbi:hypothetical protein ACT4S2_08605 [Kocuria turfanensis]|uniref:hypothetical protein n=1 Tax=Kocuria turfanensis TaxID=388357 RepID=UPI00403612B7